MRDAIGARCVRMAAIPNTYGARAWNPVKGAWQVCAGAGAIALPPSAMVYPDRLYHVRVGLVCDGQEAALECAPKETQSVTAFARRVQLAASIHHAGQYGCAKCAEALLRETTHAERQWLYSEVPIAGELHGGAATLIRRLHEAGIAGLPT